MADEPEQELGAIALPLVWVGVDELPVRFINQFIGQAEANEVYLTVGTVVPPVLLGSPEEKIEQAKQLDYVPVKAVARFGFTPTRLRELIDLLQQTLRIHEEVREAAERGKSGT